MVEVEEYTIRMPNDMIVRVQLSRPLECEAGWCLEVMCAELSVTMYKAGGAAVARVLEQLHPEHVHPHRE